MLRIAIVNSMVSAPQNWKHEGNLLLLSKLGRYLARTGRAHTYLLVPDNGDLSFWQDEPCLTLKALPSLFPEKCTSGMGYVVDPAAVIQAIRDYGLDMVFVTHSRLATMLASIYEADGAWRGRSVQAPLILWDGTPAGEDVVERGAGSGGWSAAAGFVLAGHVWSFSDSVFNAAMTEVRTHYGFAAANNLLEKGTVISAVIDREYMDQVAGEPVEKRPVFTVHTGGRWSATKGYGTVAQAVMKLKASGEEIAMLNTGMPGSSSVFEKAVAETGIEVVTGLTQEEMWRLVKSCHVGVLSQDCQAVPAMAFEQMALGLPVLVKATSRLPDVMPQYPLVWGSTEELMALLTELKGNYDRLAAECRNWFEANWHKFDISLAGPIVDRIAEGLTAVSVPIRFDEQRRISLAPRAKTMLFFQQSIFATTMARREAKRLGLVEKLADEFPVYEESEGDGSPAEAQGSKEEVT